MASGVYNKGKVIANGASGWYNGASTYRVLLVTGTYVPNPDHNFVADLTNELSGGGYVRKDITGRSVAQDNVNDRANYMGDNPTWSGLSSTQTYRYAIYYRFVTNDADSELVCWIDMTGRDLTGITDYTLKHDGQASNGRVFSGV